MVPFTSTSLADMFSPMQTFDNMSFSNSSLGMGLLSMVKQVILDFFKLKVSGAGLASKITY